MHCHSSKKVCSHGRPGVLPPRSAVSKEIVILMHRTQATLISQQCVCLPNTDGLRAMVSATMPDESAGFLVDTVHSRVGQLWWGNSQQRASSSATYGTSYTCKCIKRANANRWAGPYAMHPGMRIPFKECQERHVKPRETDCKRERKTAHEIKTDRHTMSTTSHKSK